MSRPEISAPSGAELQPGTVVGQRFRVEQVLDRGSLAQVYRATDLESLRMVALKVLSAQLPKQEWPGRRLRRELNALRKLSHPNIAQVHATGAAQDGRPWIAMEYLDGETLRRHLRRHRILTVEEMLPIAQQLAEALSHAHAAGVMHRDLKPENIFVMRSGLVKVADFGTARLLADVHGQRGVDIGTPAYMAPERLIENASSLAEDPRSDLYSLGIVEYEMLAGYNPVLGDQKALSRAEVSWRQAAVPPRVPVGVPLEVWSVLEPTLRKEPDRRPASAREHALQLERLVKRFGGQRSALPPAWALAVARTPTQLVVRRTVRSLATGAAIGAMGGTLVFVGWWLGSHQSPREAAPPPSAARPPGPPPPTPSFSNDTDTKPRLRAPDGR